MLPGEQRLLRVDQVAPPMRMEVESPLPVSFSRPSGVMVGKPAEQVRSDVRQIVGERARDG